MNLSELIDLYPTEPATAVPDWMTGTFKRHCISFANGLSDIDTHVFWLQSRNFSIDLRLPVEAEQLAADCTLSTMTKQQLAVLAQYQGWCCPSVWDEQTQQLSWLAGSSLQLHTQWPEPGILKRVGNCMMEFCPSDMYIEDWRLQNMQDGPLLGMYLEQEYNPHTGQQYHAGGGLIINGEYAALVLGRPQQEEDRCIEQSQMPPQKLPQLASLYSDQPEQLTKLFNCETSVAKGNLQDGYQIMMSTQPTRQQQALFELDGFEYLGDGQVKQSFILNGEPRERLFRVDVIRPQFSYSASTATTAAAQDWYSKEADWLTRYTQPVL